MRRSFVIEVILSLGIAQLGMGADAGAFGDEFVSDIRLRRIFGLNTTTGIRRLACRRVVGISVFLLGVFALNIRRATNAKLLHPVDQ
jgi:hypothetical protein